MYLDGIWEEASGALEGSVMLKGIKISRYPDGVITIYDCLETELIYPDLNEYLVKVIVDNGWAVGVNKVVVIRVDEILAKIEENIRIELLNKHNKRIIKKLKEKRDELIELRRNAYDYIIKTTDTGNHKHST